MKTGKPAASRMVKFFAVFCATASLGCAAEVVPEEEIAETEQAFGRWVYSWGTRAGADLDLGSDANKTCFLAGVAGNLSVGVNTGSSNPRADARVFRSGGKYWLRARANQYLTGTTPVMAHAVCVPWTTGRTGEYVWVSGTGSHYLDGSEGKQCFLTRVSGQAGIWDADSDNVSLRYRGPDERWTWDGSVPPGGYFFSQTADVRAVCFNLPAGVVSTGTGTVLSPATSQPILADERGGVCGLVGVAGRFDTNVWENGALIRWPDDLPGDWTMSVKHLKKGHYRCLL